MSFLYKPHTLIILFSIFLLNITSVSITYVYMNKSKDLLYEQTFKYLQFITNIKKQQLDLFFKSKKTNITIMSKSPILLSFADKLSVMSEKTSNKNKTENFKKIYNDNISIHKNLQSFIQDDVYADIMIVSAKDNYILYSADKTELISKKLCNDSPVYNILEKVLQTKQFYIGDISLCPLHNKATMHMAAPLIKNSKIIAILVIELPSESINEIISYRVGMGDSGETYAVGEDFQLRSDSYLKQDFTVSNSRLETNPLIQTEASINVFLGKEGVGIIKDYRDISVLSAYQTQKFNDFSWAIISEIDESEVLSRVNIIKKEILIWATLISIILTIIGYFIIKKIIYHRVISPLNKINQKAKGLSDIIENSLNEVYVFDKETFKFNYANKVALKNIQYSLDEIKQFVPVNILAEYDDAKFLKLVNKLLSKEKSYLEFTTTQMRKDKTTYPVNIKLQLINVDNIYTFVAIINDISEKIKALEEKDIYYQQSTHDHLTKAYNRQKFDEIYMQEVKRAKRYDTDLCLILLDIDDFKQVNDTYGHDIGDMVLIDISKLIKKNIRDSDLFARWGGEEFVILLPNTGIQMAIEKAELLRQTIEKEEFAKAGYITCSFGVSKYLSNKNPEYIFKQADNALYLAKHNGKNIVEYISKTI